MVVADWLFNTDVWSRGEKGSSPENSQITAVPEVPEGLGVIVMTVAPATLFCAYHMSAMIFAPVSVALAPAASW